VTSRTSCGRSAISAIPPALSVIGPNASSATIRPVSDSCAMTATPMPYTPASSLAPRMPPAITIAGAAVAWNPCARPWMMLVAWPVTDARAVVRTGRKRVEV
jgi:hypothetical protein